MNKIFNTLQGLILYCLGCVERKISMRTVETERSHNGSCLYNELCVILLIGKLVMLYMQVA